MKTVLFAALALAAAAFLSVWRGGIRGHIRRNLPAWRDTLVGFVTNVFDTLGIGSFATTSAFYKIWGLVEDDQVPGTLMVGHTPPSLLQAYIFIAVVQVDLITLSLMIAASAVGSWLGAGVV